jgi:hypothetical protein
MSRRPLIWPPKVGERIHFDVGHAHRAWSGEVRAIVDEDVAVVKRWRKHKGWHVYEILERIDVEIGNEMGPRYFLGPLPRAKVA